MKLNIPIRKQLKVIALLFLLGINCGVLLAQNPLVKQWDKRFGGTENDVLTTFIKTADGGYLLGGSSYSNIGGDKTQNTSGQEDYWIVKIDSIGNKQWDKDFGAAEIDRLFSLQQTLDGGYIIGGYSLSSISSNDYWIIKIDLLGNIQWDKHFGGVAWDDLTSLQQTADGGYILGGWSNSNISGDKTQNTWGGSEDYWIVKIDSLGNKQWDKDFGGNDFDELTSLQQTSDGGYLLGGYSYSGISGDKTQNIYGGYDYWIVKIDSLGNKQWDKDFGGNNNDQISSMLLTTDGGYILGGSSESGITGDKTENTWGSRDYWIIKIDSLGNKQWEKDYGGIDVEQLFSIQHTADKGYLISGYSYSPISGNKTENNLGAGQTWVVKTDSIGNLQWDKTLHTTGDELVGCAVQTKDGCFAFANYTRGGIAGDKTQPAWGPSGYVDYWIIKFCDTTSVALPNISFASTDTSFCEKHCIDFYDLSTSNPTSWQWFFPGSDSLTSTEKNPTNICYNTYGNFDVTLIACNAVGCDTLVLPGFINEYQTPKPTITQSNDTLFSSSSVAYQWWSVDSGIIAGANNYYYIPTQDGNYFVIVTDTIGCSGASNTIITGVTELTVSNGQLTITPNPNNGTFSITLPLTITKDFSVHIINPLGQTTYNKQTAISNGQQTIDVQIENAVKGLYLVEVVNDDKIFRGKFMVK